MFISPLDQFQHHWLALAVEGKVAEAHAGEDIHGHIEVGGQVGGLVGVTAQGDDKSTGNINLLLPASSLEKLAALCKDEDEFYVGIAGKNLVFMRQGFKLPMWPTCAGR